MRNKISNCPCIVFSVSHEYCNYETFTASCRNHDVIVMTKAMYGFMGVSRCALHDFGKKYSMTIIKVVYNF